MSARFETEHDWTGYVGSGERRFPILFICMELPYYLRIEQSINFYVEMTFVSRRRRSHGFGQVMYSRKSIRGGKVHASGGYCPTGGDPRL